MYQKAKKYLLKYSKQKAISTKRNWSDEDVISIMYEFVNDEIIKLTENNIYNWINIKNGQPTSGQNCWVVNDKGDLYLAKYGRYQLFSNNLIFVNMLEKKWAIKNVKRWTPLIAPHI